MIQDSIIILFICFVACHIYNRGDFEGGRQRETSIATACSSRSFTNSVHETLRVISIPLLTYWPK